MRKVELLAPAGNRESFVGAINAGANAVYLAGKSFGARKHASNFTDEELKEMIRYAHKRNVLIFVTVNTIIFEDEITALIEYTDFLVESNVDALIVQDLGMIDYFIKRYPTTQIHASTQMNVYSKSQVEYLKKIGVSRIILARETGINDINKFNEIGMDLEVFAHGALCVSYSGNCLLSSLKGNRSGNRGECAQPCRLQYKLLRNNAPITENSYLLSTKDLSTINTLPVLLDAGVMSLKIEGRMRSPEYVIATIRAYKEAIEHYYNKKDFDINKRIIELKKVFNRQYTEGYINEIEPFSINNDFRPNHQGIDLGVVTNYSYGKVEIELHNSIQLKDGIRFLGTKDTGGIVHRILKNNSPVTSAKKGERIVVDMPNKIEVGSLVRKTIDAVLNAELSKYLDEHFKLITLDFDLDISIGFPIKLKVTTSHNKIIELSSDYIVEEPKGEPQLSKQIIEQLTKLGNTHYEAGKVSIKYNEDGFIPNSVIKKLRRDAITLIEEEQTNTKIKPAVTIKHNIEKSFPTIVCKVETIEQYETAKELGIDNILYSERLREKIENNNHQYLFLNRIQDHKIDEQYIVVNDFGYLLSNQNIITNSHFNVVNSKSLSHLFTSNVDRVTLSIENSVDNIKRMIKTFKRTYNAIPPIEYVVYGKQDAMISKYCPITKGEKINKKNCEICEKFKYHLQDEQNNKYPLRRDSDCNMRIVHYKAINNIHNINTLKDIGVNYFRIEFVDESTEEVRSVINRVKKII